MEIPRWCRYTSFSDTAELHVFSDLLSIAYRPVANLRIVTAGNLYYSLVISKSRLAPIRNKTMTIPRLELQTIVLATRSKTTTVEKLKLNIESVHLWSSSATVLECIRNENVNLEKLIMHRANEIRNNSNIQDWPFITTELNLQTIVVELLSMEFRSSFLISTKYRRKN